MYNINCFVSYGFYYLINADKYPHFGSGIYSFPGIICSLFFSKFRTFGVLTCIFFSISLMVQCCYLDLLNKPGYKISKSLILFNLLLY